jgi:hypothetical protein
MSKRIFKSPYTVVLALLLLAAGCTKQPDADTPVASPTAPIVASPTTQEERSSTDKKVEDFAEKLRAIRSAAESGTDFETYSKELAQLELSNQTLQADSLGSAEFRENSSKALEYYNQAALAWELKRKRAGKVQTLEVFLDETYLFPEGTADDEDGILAIRATGNGIDASFEAKPQITIDEIIERNWEFAGKFVDKALSES